MSKRRNTTRKALQMESLEDRQLMAADIGLGPDGVLRVEGTCTDDIISIDQVFVSNIQRQSRTKLGFVSRAPVSSAFKIRASIANSNGVVQQQKIYDLNDVQYIHAFGMDGNDTIKNNTDIASELFGGSGNDRLYGGTSTDRILGDSGNDTLVGNSGDDSLFGHQGADKLYGKAGNDTLEGGSGNDYLSGAGGNDKLYGRSGNDKLYGWSGDDKLYGGTGADKLYGKSGNDMLNGGSGNDYLSGASGDDKLYGKTGNDTLKGGSGNDYLSGASGADKLYGESGKDKLYGWNGDDKLYGGTGADMLNGGSGNDYLSGASGADKLYGKTGNDTLKGGSGNDHLSGASGDDKLYGGNGNDTLYGWSGQDYLSGGAGLDGLFGGRDPDQLRGGSGADRFLVLEDQPNQFLGMTYGYDSDDTLLDENGNDAKIVFKNGESRTFQFSGDRWAKLDGGQFTDAEIVKVDRALADLHLKTRNTTLLKEAGWFGGELVFERLGAQVAGNFTPSGVNGGGKITLMDTSFNGDRYGADDSLVQTVFHEIAHNWDNENDRWDEWKEISGWRGSFWSWEDDSGYTESLDKDWFHESSATFARDYGQTNPKEDFATYFAKVMMDDSGRTFKGEGAGSSSAEKESFMDDFFASLT